MKFKINIFLVLVLILSCGKPNEPTLELFESFTYPLDIGNKWIYERTITRSNIVPDKVYNWFTPVRKGSVSIEITEIEIVIDSIGDSLAMSVLQTYAIDSLNPQFGDSATFRFRNEKDGLYEYGNSGSNLAVPVSRPPTYDDFEKMFCDKKNKINFTSTYLHAEKKQSIKYPVNIRNEWMFLDIQENLFGINKKIIGYDLLEFNSIKYNCFKVEWIYSERDVTIIDYISEIGLMKRTISGKNIHTCNLAGSECITFDMTDEYSLVEFNKEL